MRQAPNRKHKPLENWEDMVGENISERGTGRARRFDHENRECLDRERLKLFCHSHPLWRSSEGMRPVICNGVDSVAKS